jgi:radical SAM-linked protein
MRLRITFSKSGALRYTGHLDLHSIWERTVRRAGLPLAYTQGFHPGPKIQLASALPLGFIGKAEIVDLWIDAPENGLDRPFKEILQPAAPPGLVISSVEIVDEHNPALQTQVISADYEVTLLEPVDRIALADGISALLSVGSLIRERRGKTYDLRPLVESLSLASAHLLSGEGEGVRVLMTLAAREGATGRPEEVLDALGIPSEIARVERTRLILR